MRIARLKGENLRRYAKLELEPGPRLNVVTGQNGAGKTTLLEAIYLLSRGRSFRTANLGEVAGTAGPAWSVFAETVAGDQSRERLGIGWQDRELTLRLNERTATGKSELATLFPVQLIDRSAHRLVEEGPSYRRSFIDWGVFHVEHSFIEHWRRYQRALRQRNRALRLQMSVPAINAWNEELADSGELLTAQRQAQLDKTRAALQRYSEALLGELPVDWELLRGWPPDQTLKAILEDNIEQHLRAGTTLQGPHRADLRILVSERRGGDRLSGGQQKLLVTAMVLAQCEAIATQQERTPVVLIDDFAAELSGEYQQRLARVLQDYKGQVVVTAFERPAALADADIAMFHVEHGQLKALTPSG